VGGVWHFIDVVLRVVMVAAMAWRKLMFSRQALGVGTGRHHLLRDILACVSIHNRTCLRRRVLLVDVHMVLQLTRIITHVSYALLRSGAVLRNNFIAQLLARRWRSCLVARGRYVAT